MEKIDSSELQRAAKVFESRGLDTMRVEGIEAIKTVASELHARYDRIPIPPENREAGRLVALAKTALEESVMWAVKAVSRG